MASTFYEIPRRTVLPIPLIREEVLKLTPDHSVMVNFMLADLEARAPLLTEREQVQELLISILAALNPSFPLTAASQTADR